MSQINQITKILMPDGTEVALTDWSDRPIYSRGVFLAGFTDLEVRLFSYTEGEQVATTQNVPVAARYSATGADTNIDSAGEMAATEEFLVYSIKVEVHQLLFNTGTNLFTVAAAGLPIPTATVLGEINRRMTLALEVSQKDFPKAGMGWFVTGFGPTIAVSSTAAVRTYANQGAPTHEASYPLSIPVHIGGTEDYTVLAANPDGLAFNLPDDAGGTVTNGAFSLRVFLCGLQKRSAA